MCIAPEPGAVAPLRNGLRALHTHAEARRWAEPPQPRRSARRCSGARDARRPAAPNLCRYPTCKRLGPEAAPLRALCRDGHAFLCHHAAPTRGCRRPPCLTFQCFRV